MSSVGFPEISQFRLYRDRSIAHVNCGQVRFMAKVTCADLLTETLSFSLVNFESIKTIGCDEIIVLSPLNIANTASIVVRRF